MAERLMQRCALWLVTGTLLSLLSACVSTEELYAPYDAAQCLLVVQEHEDGTQTLRELISNLNFPWEPAVYFDFDSHRLNDENRALLVGAVEILKRYPQLNLSLQGFADRIGTRRYNHALAGRRVVAVREYFVSKGIDRPRIVDQPLGEGLTQFGDDDVISRSINRRVELMLLDEQGRPLHPLFDFTGL
ncbi:MAG: OmpA family protein [Granulosicoccus sp.]|nr:OmpA family protein [Granulosicoccus sp.]